MHHSQHVGALTKSSPVKQHRRETHDKGNTEAWRRERVGSVKMMIMMDSGAVAASSRANPRRARRGPDFEVSLLVNKVDN